MSEQSFARLAFPSFRGPATQARDEQATERGYAAGYAAGLRAAAAETAALRQSLSDESAAEALHARARTESAVAVLASAAAALAAAETALRTESQETLVETALDLVDAILGYEIRTNPASTALAAVTRAMDVADAATVVSVRLNPLDLSVLPGHVAESLGVALVADAAIARGGARADLPRGFVDAAIGTALDRARRVLLEGGAA